MSERGIASLCWRCGHTITSGEKFDLIRAGGRNVVVHSDGSCPA